MAEQHTGRAGLGEVQYVFLELPKYAADAEPQTTAEKWAWFFRSARSLEQVPASLSHPYTTALDLAAQAGGVLSG